jgi:hypothetical protein
MGYWGEDFWREALWADSDPRMGELEREIHDVLAQLSHGRQDRHEKWRNTRCDVHVVWAHVWQGTDALLTNDHDDILSKADTLSKLGANVESPEAFPSRLPG